MKKIIFVLSLFLLAFAHRRRGNVAGVNVNIPPRVTQAIGNAVGNAVMDSMKTSMMDALKKQF